MNKSDLLTNAILSRSAMWERHAFRNHRVAPEVFSDIFKYIFNTLQEHPSISLSNATDQILALLEKN